MEQIHIKPEHIAYKGRLFEVVEQEQPNGKIYEKARRAPGVRLIIFDSSSERVLLTREWRQELQGWDYRLPGGKVFDTLEEYDAFRNSDRDIEIVAAEKAQAEALEEAGIDVCGLRLEGVSRLGATVEWDLYLFEAAEFGNAAGGQRLEEGEVIEANNWFALDEVEQMIMAGVMQEDRVAMLLLRWINKKQEVSNEI